MLQHDQCPEMCIVDCWFGVGKRGGGGGRKAVKAPDSALFQEGHH